jgi:hypothetical protein
MTHNRESRGVSEDETLCYERHKGKSESLTPVAKNATGFGMTRQRARRDPSSSREQRRDSLGMTASGEPSLKGTNVLEKRFAEKRKI